MTYSGETNENGKPHGQGKMTYPDGTSYEGQWKDGLSNGHGVGLYGDGGRYEGNWKSGEPHGYGILYCPKNNSNFYDRYEGSWENGLVHDRGTWFYAEDNPVNLVSWEGAHVEGKMIDCNATITWKNPGSRYIGQVKNSAAAIGLLIDGPGVYIFEDGTRVNGVFRFNIDKHRIELIQGTAPGDVERWLKMWGISNDPISPKPNPSQTNTSGGSGFWGALGAFAGGFLGSSSGSHSSGSTWQCINGHTMTSTFNPGSCSWCGNTMWPK